MVLAFSTAVLAQPRLIGITGNQGPGGPNPDPNDERLYEINLTNFSLSPIIKMPWVPDTDSIAFNPDNGLLYGASGADSYSNNPTSNGYRDNQYMQTIAINSAGLEQAAIFNANSEGNQNGTFGLAAPRPDWVLPAECRTDAQTGGEFRVRGPDEYHALRDFTWSSTEDLFYGADETGLYRVTPGGDSTFVAGPVGGGQYKGITFFNVNNQRRLLVSDRDGGEL